MSRTRRHLRYAIVLVILLFVLAGIGLAWLDHAAVPVRAALETEPVPHSSDAADDVCIWLHPTDLSLSTVIGTDKDGGIAVYALDGTQIQYRDDGRLNNVDVRYNFPWGSGAGALLAASNRSARSIDCYQVDVETRMLVPKGKVQLDFEPYGLCLYHNRERSTFYAFATDMSGLVEQWQLTPAEGGPVGKRVSGFRLNGKAEGCVADDEQRILFVAEEKKGIWSFGAEPEAKPLGALLLPAGLQGPLRPDIEGLTIYRSGPEQGYLIASSQGNSQFALFARSAPHKHIGNFRIHRGVVDAVTGTDGIDVTNASLGGQFGRGLFVAQDDKNDRGNQNFKFVRWDDIATAFNPQLLIDTNWDTRTIGEGTVEKRSDGQ